MTGKQAKQPTPAPDIVQSILILRGQRVLLDSDLAALYGVPTKALNQAVKRNPDRFPADFMFRLNADEVAQLNRSQFVTGSQKHRDPRYPPCAFTEHGAIQASNVLSSSRAIEMGIHVVRAFVQLRSLLASNKALAQKLGKLERKVSSHDQTIVGILKAIRELTAPPEPKKRFIGFVELQERKR